MVEESQINKIRIGYIITFVVYLVFLWYFSFSDKIPVLSSNPLVFLVLSFIFWGIIPFVLTRKKEKFLKFLSLFILFLILLYPPIFDFVCSLFYFFFPKGNLVRLYIMGIISISIFIIPSLPGFFNAKQNFQAVLYDFMFAPALLVVIGFPFFVTYVLCRQYCILLGVQKEQSANKDYFFSNGQVVVSLLSLLFVIVLSNSKFFSSFGFFFTFNLASAFMCVGIFVSIFRMITYIRFILPTPVRAWFEGIFCFIGIAFFFIRILGIGLDFLDLDTSTDVGLFGADSHMDIYSSDVQGIDVSLYSDIGPLELVSGYFRKDGVYVQSYVRTIADGSVFNNLK